MTDNRRPNYGLDAPLAVRNLLIVATLGILTLIARLLHLWSRQDTIALIARPLMSAGLSCAYVTEVGNSNAYYTVAKDENDVVVGYAGMWVIMDEIHITTIAVDPSQRGRKIGERLLFDILEEGMARGAERRAVIDIQSNCLSPFAPDS